ncbi:FecR domain-containing protein [Sphingosinicellaceae bacterium]|nr:FecR domain-containing protein [Sphingosinicellaceae bacterium]
MDDQALDWVIRQRETAFADWEAFAAWLGTSPGHADAYHALADAERELDDLVPRAPRPLFAPAPRRAIPRRAWLGGAIAASLLVLGYGALGHRTAPYDIETAAGETRTLTLADGSQVAMNGGTRLTLDHNDARAVTLDHGEAVFTVVHNAADPFRLAVGGATLVDAGTVFNVVRRDGSTDVAVAEGAVVYNPKGENVHLSGGRTLHVVDRDTRLVIGEIEPGVIGAWRTGRLVYAGTPLALVAEDLTRNLGTHITASPAVAARKFRGVISFGRDRNAVMNRLGPLLGVEVRPVADGWLLAERTG